MKNLLVSRNQTNSLYIVFFYYEFFTQIHEYKKIDIFVIPHEYLSFVHYLLDIQVQKFPKLPGLQVSPSSLMDPDVANLLNNATTSHNV